MDNSSIEVDEENIEKSSPRTIAIAMHDWKYNNNYIN